MLILTPECSHSSTQQSLSDAIAACKRTPQQLLIPVVLDLQGFAANDLVRQLGLGKFQLIRYSKDNPDAFLRTLRKYCRRSFPSGVRLLARRALLLAFLTLPVLPYVYFVTSSCFAEVATIKAERQKRVQLERTLKETRTRLNELLKKSRTAKESK